MSGQVFSLSTHYYVLHKDSAFASFSHSDSLIIQHYALHRKKNNKISGIASHYTHLTVRVKLKLRLVERERERILSHRLLAHGVQ